MLHIVLLALVVWVGAVVVTAAALQVISLRRRRRKAPADFPYLHLPETPVGENTLRVYSYGRDLYDAMLAAITYATESIYLESFIFKRDAVGREFRDRLLAKAAEGVAVYVILDGFGNLLVRRSFSRFPPLIHAFRFWGIRRPWHLLDPRRYVVDHRKILVIDGRIAFLGGFNIGRNFAADWRDTHVRVRGPAATEVAQAFVDFWNRHVPHAKPITRRYQRTFDPTIALWNTDAFRLTFPIRSMYLKAIERAERVIRLTNAYFVPDRILLGALKAAANRGVDVQVLVPHVSNHVLADWASRGSFSACLRAGVRVFGYRGAMIHAKSCCVDGQWSTIGTANLDRLSSVGNFEINLEIYSPEIAAQLEDLFDCDRQSAREFTYEAWCARPWYTKLAEYLITPLRLLV